MLNIASLPLPAWQAIFLILLSFGSLIIALYCLLFMVPLKKFVQRIESLGGGMEGIKNHLKGVEDYTEKELQRMETRLSGRIDDIENETGKQIESSTEEARKVSMNALKNFDSLRKELAESLDSMNVQMARKNASFENIEGRLRELKRDVSVLAEEIEGKLNKQVRDSFYELEATILATLEVMRDELMPPKKNSYTPTAGTCFPHGPRKKGTLPDKGSSFQDSKIISAGPLFSRSPSSETASQEEKGKSKDGDEPGK